MALYCFFLVGDFVACFLIAFQTTTPVHDRHGDCLVYSFFWPTFVFLHIFALTTLYMIFSTCAILLRVIRDVVFMDISLKMHWHSYIVFFREINGVGISFWRVVEIDACLRPVDR